MYYLLRSGDDDYYSDNTTCLSDFNSKVEIDSAKFKLAFDQQNFLYYWALTIFRLTYPETKRPAKLHYEVCCTTNYSVFVLTKIYGYAQIETIYCHQFR